MEPPLIALLLVGALLAILIPWEIYRRRQAARPVVTNRLEELLWHACQSGQEPPELPGALCEATLFAWKSNEGSPMTMSFDFSKANLGSPHAMQLGPFLYCFSSRTALNRMRLDPVLAELFAQAFQIEEFPATQVLQVAIEQNVEVQLNPFASKVISIRFSPEDIRRLLHKA